MSIDPVNTRIAARMAALGLSQSELARRLGTGQSTVQGWVEAGKLPGTRYLADLPAALECSGHWLLTGEGPIEPPGQTPTLAEMEKTIRAEAVQRIVSAVVAAAYQAGDQLLGLRAVDPSVGELVERIGAALATTPPAKPRVRGAGAKAG